ncbi:hypothetical protein VULLAG_LOCUS7916 [Vulpes lagopus]
MLGWGGGGVGRATPGLQVLGPTGRRGAGGAAVVGVALDSRGSSDPDLPRRGAGRGPRRGPGLPRLRGARAPVQGSAVGHEAVGQAEAEAQAAVAGQGQREQRHEEQRSRDQPGRAARVPQVRGAGGRLGAQELGGAEEAEA